MRCPPQAEHYTLVWTDCGGAHPWVAAPFSTSPPADSFTVRLASDHNMCWTMSTSLDGVYPANCGALWPVCAYGGWTFGEFNPPLPYVCGVPLALEPCESTDTIHNTFTLLGGNTLHAPFWCARGAPRPMRAHERTSTHRLACAVPSLELSAPDRPR